MVHRITVGHSSNFIFQHFFVYTKMSIGIKVVVSGCHVFALDVFVFRVTILL